MIKNTHVVHVQLCTKVPKFANTVMSHTISGKNAIPIFHRQTNTLAYKRILT